MKFRYMSLLAAFLAASACADQSSPTSADLEQAVFNALGGLNVGESLSLVGDAAQEVVFGGQPDDADFVVIPFFASKTASATLGVEIAGSRSPDSATDEPPRFDASASPLDPDPLLIENDEMHRRLQARFRAAAAPKLAELRRSRPVAPRLLRAAATPLGGGNARVDQLVEINTTTAAPFCTATDFRTGRVEAISQHAIVVGDVDNPDGGFTRADYESFASQFDSLVEPTITGVFGEPTDIDDNDRVIIFFTRAVNELTTPGMQGFIGGFFYSRDMLLKEEDGCPASNEGEIFYILAPDPNAEASHIRHLRDDVFRDALGTIGHEFQHLINSGRRVRVTNAPLEDIWLDEGLSHIAEELLFYAAAGVQPESNVAVADLSDPRFPNLLDAINQFGVSNLVRYGLYLEDVTGQSPTDSDDDLETRGATWAFLRYAADHDPRPDAEFFRALVDTKLTGYNNLEAVLGHEPLESLQTWGVSVYTDDWLVNDPNPAFEQPSWNFRSLLPQLFNDRFPLATQTLGGGGSVSFQLSHSTSGYVKVHNEGGTVSHIQTTSGGGTPPQQLRVTVVRTN